MGSVPGILMTCDIVLRSGTSDDVCTCAEIHQRWLDDTPWMPRLHDLEETTAWMRTEVFPILEVTVAETDGDVHGYVAVDSTSIVSLTIADGWRRKSIGSRLLGHAKGLRPKGLTLWTFEANEAAQRFYARHGFVEIRRTAGDNAEGLPDVLMGWVGDA